MKMGKVLNASRVMRSTRHVILKAERLDDSLTFTVESELNSYSAES